MCSILKTKTISRFPKFSEENGEGWRTVKVKLKMLRYSFYSIHCLSKVFTVDQINFCNSTGHFLNDGTNNNESSKSWSFSATTNYQEHVTENMLHQIPVTWYPLYRLFSTKFLNSDPFHSTQTLSVQCAVAIMITPYCQRQNRHKTEKNQI